jgi:pilus assembly protein FimV
MEQTARVSLLERGTSVIKHLRSTVSALLAVAALLSPLSAWALGLGQMEVRSQRDEPLLAEIPIISSDPAELEALQARLASPETFARIGLAPPSGIVTDLQFNVALDARGRPVIRVTSAVPVQQPLLTFLVEVDWGQGRLVREYSALIDTPQTAAAPVQPPIEEAVVGTQNTIVRPTDPTLSNPLESEAPTALPLDPKPVATATPDSTNPLQSQQPMAVPLSPTQPAPSEVAPAMASVQPPPAPAAPLSATSDTHLVQRGETLGGIASRLASGYTLDQTIVALLRANPDAFIAGNANRLKAGAVLRIPDGAGIASYSPDEAALVMREQMTQWRGERRALPQPPAVVGVASEAGQTSVPRTAASETSASAGVASAAAARRASEARLQIVPASASAAGRAATRSGVSAGGKGDMLQQQELLETKETLAARSVEVEELKARVAELENLKAQQEKLIALKDSELATAQQRLAGADTSQAAATSAATSVASKPSETSGFGPWLGVGAGLLAIGLLAVFWLRRKSAATRPSFAPSKLEVADASALEPEPIPDDFLGDEAAVRMGFDHEADEAFEPDTMPAAEPAWSRGARTVDDIPAPAPLPLRNTAPTWHDPLNVSLDEAAASAEVASLNPTPPGLARIDLAKAYLEMGDRDTARALLREVSVLGDRASRDEAARLLRELA